MIVNLEQMGQPDWLARIDSEKMMQNFPLTDLLSGSLYYPAAGLDGDPVAYLSGNFVSFVYVDYGISRKELLNEVNSPGFTGYEAIGHRSLSKELLTPHGWMPTAPSSEDGDSANYRDWMKQPFCEWFVFQRRSGYSDDHGAARFSLLYLCADGVAAFQALYLSNHQFPGGIAIIQHGTEFGKNWTDFTNEKGPLARAVLKNPSGVPKVLLYGGAGGRHIYESPCWSQYSESLGFLGDTSIHVFCSSTSRT